MSKSIKDLREALQKQSQETMKLQEEATKFLDDSTKRREGSSSPYMADSGVSSQNLPASRVRSVATEGSVSSAPGTSSSNPVNMSSNPPFSSGLNIQSSILGSTMMDRSISSASGSTVPFMSSQNIPSSSVRSGAMESSVSFAPGSTVPFMSSQNVPSSSMHSGAMESSVSSASGSMVPFMSSQNVPSSSMHSGAMESSVSSASGVSGPLTSSQNMPSSGVRSGTMESSISFAPGSTVPFMSSQNVPSSSMRSGAMESSVSFAPGASGPLTSSQNVPSSGVRSGTMESSISLAPGSTVPFMSSQNVPSSSMRSGAMESSVSFAPGASGPLTSSQNVPSSGVRSGTMESSISLAPGSTVPFMSSLNVPSSSMRSGATDSSVYFAPGVSGPLTSSQNMPFSGVRSGTMESSVSFAPGSTVPFISSQNVPSSSMRSGAMESSVSFAPGVSGPLTSSQNMPFSGVRSGTMESSISFAPGSSVQFTSSQNIPSSSVRRAAGESSISFVPGVSGPLTSSQKLPSSSVRGEAMEGSVSFAPFASGSPPKILYTRYEMDVECQRKTPKHSGIEQTEALLREYAQQIRDLQKRLSEATQHYEQQSFTLRQTVIQLQTNLQEVIKEKNSITDLRQKESQSQEDLNSKMKTTISELQTANQLQEEMLKETNNQIEHLKMMLRGHEDVFQGLRNVLVTYEEYLGMKIYEHENVFNLHTCSLPTAFSKALQELNAVESHVRGRVMLLEEQLEITRKESQSKTETLLQQHQESIEKLINEHERELEALNENANASHSLANNVQSQLEIVQEQAKNQTSLYMRQISQLESTVSQLRSELRGSRKMSQDKIEELEKELHLAHSEIAEAKNERDQYSQETGNLDDQVQHLMSELHKKELELNLEKEQNKRLWDRDTGSSITIDNLRRELDNKNMELQRMDSFVKSMRMECEEQMERQISAIREKNTSAEKLASIATQQESTKDMLHKVLGELTEKKIKLEAAERQVAELTACLNEKEKVIKSTNEEIQKLNGRVDGKLQELQQLKNDGDHLQSIQSECESLKLQLMEKEKVVEILQKQIENMTQIVDQHGQMFGSMEMEKAHLLREVNEKKRELQELKILQDKKDSQIRTLEANLSEMELERVKLMNANSERLRALKEMKLDREDLMSDVRASRFALATLAEESEAIRSDYQEKNEEMEATVSKLKMQLKSAQIELEQTRATLKAMEGSDGHAMKVAMGMQKQVTAKRGQIDALQSKIKFLEEAMTNATKEKHYLKEERTKLSHELTCMASLNNKMAAELEILKAQDKRLKEKLATVEAALDKASMQFAECQCVMQRQEQEVMRCKLQHALDVKELQGPGYALKPCYSSLPHSHSSSAPASQSFAGHISLLSSRSGSSKEDPLRDLKLLLHELRSTIDEIPSTILPRKESDSDTDLILEGASNIFGDSIGRRTHETYSREAAVRDLPSDVIMGQGTFSRDPLTLHTADLEHHESTFPLSSSVPQAVFASTPRYTSSKKLSPEQRSKDRSPVHLLLTAPPEDPRATSTPSLERRSSLKKSSSPEATTSAATRNISFSTSSTMQTEEANGNACKKLQSKMESLQTLVENLQIKNQAMSSMIKCQEKKIEQVKEKEKKLSK